MLNLDHGAMSIADAPTQELIQLLSHTWGEHWVAPRAATTSLPPVGPWFRERRIAMRQCILEAALVAGIPALTWRDIEQGTLAPSPLQVADMIRAVGADIGEFRRHFRGYPVTWDRPPVRAIAPIEFEAEPAYFQPLRISNLVIDHEPGPVASIDERPETESSPHVPSVSATSSPTKRPRKRASGPAPGARTARAPRP
jgi:hypothetical protein